MEIRFISGLRTLYMALFLCMALMMPVAASASESSSAETGTAGPAHGRLTDGGYNIYCLSGGYVTADAYPSVRSVQMAFPDATLVVFYVENKGNNQITLKVKDPYSSTGYSYVGIDSSIKNGTELKLVDSPYIWNTYAENDSTLVFSLRPPDNTKMVANASGESKAPRTKIILWSYSDMNAPKNGEFRFEAVKESIKTPVTDDYSFANFTQTEGSVTPVKIEGSLVKSPGAVTVFYNGSTTLPKKAGSYRVTFDIAAAPPAWNAASGLSGGTLVIAPKPSTAAPVGKVIKMGGINWRVLDVQDGKALVLSDLILEDRSFQKKATLSNAWADSPLRTYLNNGFYNKTFSKSEKKRIVSTALVNNINPQYSTTTGTDTKDKVFLLSAEEATRYFSNNNTRTAYADRTTPAMLSSPINDLMVNPYTGVYQKYSTWLWWLRTPAPSETGDHDVLYVNTVGKVKDMRINTKMGIRPAMWINVAGGGFTSYQPLKFNKQPKYFTKEDMVLAIARDTIYANAGDWVYRFGYPARGPGVNKTQTTVGELGAMPPGYAYWHHVYRMRCWGVLSLGEFDPFEKVTYGQFKDYLMRTMAWNKKYALEGAGSDFARNFTLTQNILAIAEKRAGIKDTSAKAKPVKAEIQNLSREIIYWLKAANASNSEVRILEGPTKNKYKVGEKFDIEGLLVVTGPYGKETNVNNKLTFTTSEVTLTPGRPFQTEGQKSINISYKGKSLMTYPVTVGK